MNRVTASEYLPLIVALTQGKTIQAFRLRVDEERMDTAAKAIANYGYHHSTTDIYAAMREHFGQWEDFAPGEEIQFTCQPHLYRIKP